MTDRLIDKVCIVTGSGGSVGRASALLFAREGALLVMADKASEAAQSTLDLVRAEGGRAISLHPLDLTSRESCELLVQAAVREFGRIDVLFNNAGHFHHGWMADAEQSFWFDTIDEELHLTFLLTHAAWPELCRTGGAIVNMASTSGHTTYRALGGAAHSAAKAGIIGFTRQLAMEGRVAGVRANSLSPGVIGTPVVLSRAREDPEWDATMRGRMLRGRYGAPEEVASVALFLASDESSIVNGADIIADDGVTIWG